MAIIYTRAAKGSALTWTEGDANITNLNNAKIENVVEDTTPQLGGNLDVNGNSIVSTSNANINIEPNGTGKVVTTKTLNASILASTQSSGDEGGQFELALAATNNSLSGSVAIDINQNRLRIFETGGSNRGAYIDLSAAATGVGSNLLAGSGGVSNTADGGTTIYPLFASANSTETISNTFTSGSLSFDVSTGKLISYIQECTSRLDIQNNLRIKENSSTVYATIKGPTSYSAAYTLTLPTSAGSSNQVLTTDGSGVLSWTTPSAGLTVTNDTTTNATRYVLFDDATSGTVSAVNVSSSKLTFNPSTGRLTATELTGSLRAYNEGALYDLGTTGGTIAPNVSNGNVQKITLNSALTINAFTSPVAGQSLTLIIYGGTAYTSITSTMKFAGGVKTLTGTAGCIDILSIYYDGTNYFASLGKGFA